MRYSIGDNNELTAVGASSLTYDQFGNTLTYGLLTFTWDSEGHMLTGTDTSAFPNKVDTHEVDGDGRRMRAKLANAADWELESSYPAILAEYTLISGTFTIKSLNTHGMGLVNTNREGTKRYFHFDGLGSTWALTDGSEVVQDTYTWSAFGIQEASTGSSVNPFRYVGQYGYYDDTARGSTLGVRCLDVRYYSPALGRFLSWDSEPESASRYCYCESNPGSLVDPSGRLFVIIVLGIGFFLGGATALEWWELTRPRRRPKPLPWPYHRPIPIPLPRPLPPWDGELRCSPQDWLECVFFCRGRGFSDVLYCRKEFYSGKLICGCIGHSKPMPKL